MRHDGEYSSASDLDDETYALLAADRVGGDENPVEEHIGAEHADHYECLIVQRVLSAQMEKAKQNQRHTLFQTKCVVQERSCRVMVEKLQQLGKLRDGGEAGFGYLTAPPTLQHLVVQQQRQCKGNTVGTSQFCNRLLS